MDARSILLVIHVATAVVGLGPITAIAVLATRSRTATPDSLSGLARLVDLASWSLGLMILTGIGLLYVSGWALASFWWLRVGFLLVLVIGALLGISRGALRKAKADPARVPAALGRVTVLAWLAVLTATVIVVLMVGKPF
jgi:uncharacterized membrane protein